MTNGEKLKALRAAYHLTQDQFGAALGITKASMSSYESDRNAISRAVRYRLMRATGIGFDYFDTDMSLEEAAIKYKVDFKRLKLDSIVDCNIYIYALVADFVAGDRPIQEKIESASFLEFLSRYKSDEYYLIAVKSGEGGFLADAGDILVVSKKESLQTDDWLIVKYRNHTLLLQYFFVESDVIRLCSSSFDCKFSFAEFEKQVEVCGVIKSVIKKAVRI